MEPFAEAVRRFRAAHDEDPERRALHYHQRLAHWIERLAPDASEPLRLAAHCQHIRRWTLPRDRFAAGRAGYRRWRSTLARFHADEAEHILHTNRNDKKNCIRSCGRATLNACQMQISCST